MLRKPTRDVATVEMTKGPLSLLSAGKQRPISAAYSVNRGSQGGLSVEYVSGKGSQLGRGRRFWGKSSGGHPCAKRLFVATGARPRTKTAARIIQFLPQMAVTRSAENTRGIS